LFISNQVEIARRRGTRKLRTYQSGINEEPVLRERVEVIEQMFY
jgi:hypothetical protein